MRIRFGAYSFVATIAASLLVGTTAAGAHGAGGMSGMHGNFGGQSMSHMSSQGLANSNGPNSVDRDFGRDRASDRMSASGMKHSHRHGKSHMSSSTGMSH